MLRKSIYSYMQMKEDDSETLHSLQERFTSSSDCIFPSHMIIYICHETKLAITFITIVSHLGISLTDLFL